MITLANWTKTEMVAWILGAIVLNGIVSYFVQTALDNQYLEKEAQQILELETMINP